MNSSLTVSIPILDPKNVNAFIRATVRASELKKQAYAGGSKIESRFHILVVGRGYLVKK